MEIVNENHQPLSLDIYDISKKSEFFWVFDLEEIDWFLQKLKIIEAFECPTIKIKIMNKVLTLPSDWNILVYSEETTSLDVVNVHQLINQKFNIFLYDFIHHKVVDCNYRVVGYNKNEEVTAPCIAKKQMLCVPIEDKYWIMMSPTDVYRYIKNMSVSDLINY